MAHGTQVALELLQFERRIRSCDSNREVAFRAVNETAAALPHDQAIIWRIDALAHPMVVAGSGLADLSVESPYQQWLTRLIRGVTPEPFTEPLAISLKELPASIAEEGEEWALPNLLLCPLRAPDGTSLGGMMFARSKPFTESERATADWISQAVAYGLWAWRRERSPLWRWLRSRSALQAAVVAVTVIALLGIIPVRLSALAPAEITPMKPIPVTAPVEGVIKEVLVQPNQTVPAGATVAVLDDTSVRNRLAVAERALDIARADLQRATYKSFSDDASRMELQVLGARVQEKVAEVTFLTEVQSSLKLIAPQGGIAVFTDAEQLKGKPVQVGERVMIIADPSLIDVTIYLAPVDAVQLEPGGRVEVFLHSDPLKSLAASIDRASYEAVPSPDGTLAYIVRAQLAAGHGFPRIGLRGTAKIEAEEVTLAYYLFRKPLGYVRRVLGI